MADAVTSQTLVDNDRIAVMKFTNISDGSGESAVAKVDVSALNTHTKTGTSCSRVHLLRICCVRFHVLHRLEHQTFLYFFLLFQ